MASSAVSCCEVAEDYVGTCISVCAARSLLGVVHMHAGSALNSDRVAALRVALVQCGSAILQGLF
jgi:hypothetical protein